MLEIGFHVEDDVVGAFGTTDQFAKEATHGGMGTAHSTRAAVSDGAHDHELHPIGAADTVLVEYLERIAEECGLHRAIRLLLALQQRARQRHDRFRSVRVDAERRRKVRICVGVDGNDRAAGLRQQSRERAGDGRFPAAPFAGNRNTKRHGPRLQSTPWPSQVFRLTSMFRRAAAEHWAARRRRTVTARSKISCGSSAAGIPWRSCTRSGGSSRLATANWPRPFRKPAARRWRKRSTPSKSPSSSSEAPRTPSRRALIP